MGKKDDNQAAGSGGSCSGGNSQDIESMRRDIDEQSRQVKELSNAMLSLVDKIKKIKAEGSSGAGLDEATESRLRALEKRLDILEKAYENHECFKEKEHQPQPVKTEKTETKIIQKATAPIPPPAQPEKMAAEKKENKIVLPQLPSDLIDKKPAEMKPNAQVIESTLDDKAAMEKKLGMKDMLRPPVNNTIPLTKPAEAEKKGGMFSFIKNIFKHDTGEKLIDNNNKQLPVAMQGKTLMQISQQAKNNNMPPMPVAEKKPTQAAAPTLPPAKTETKPQEHENTPSIMDKKAPVLPTMKTEAPKTAEQAKSKDIINMEGKEVASEIDKQITKANGLVDEQRYSEATEIYLKLVDAYENNKDFDAVSKYGEKIDELYERISSRLLSSLMTSPTAKNTNAMKK